jgi:hypothetical protein
MHKLKLDTGQDHFIIIIEPCGKLFGFQKSAQRPPSRPRQNFLLIKKHLV